MAASSRRKNMAQISSKERAQTASAIHAINSKNRCFWGLIPTTGGYFPHLSPNESSRAMTSIPTGDGSIVQNVGWQDNPWHSITNVVTVSNSQSPSLTGPLVACPSSVNVDLSSFSLTPYSSSSELETLRAEVARLQQELVALVDAAQPLPVRAVGATPAKRAIPIQALTRKHQSIGLSTMCWDAGR